MLGESETNLTNKRQTEACDSVLRPTALTVSLVCQKSLPGV